MRAKNENDEASVTQIFKESSSISSMEPCDSNIHGFGGGSNRQTLSDEPAGGRSNS